MTLCNTEERQGLTNLCLSSFAVYMSNRERYDVIEKINKKGKI